SGQDFKASATGSAVARDSIYARVLPERSAVVAGPGHEADHSAVGIDKTVGRTEAAANDVIAPELREPAANFVASDQAHVLQSHGNLLFIVRAQVGQMLFARRAKKISLGTVVAWITKPLLKAGIERDRVKRHLDVDRRRKLRAHAAHAFARGPLALRGLALKDKNVFAAPGNQVVGNAGADNPSADENDVRGVHLSYSFL